MNSATESGFQLVYDMDTLTKVVAFLELGFGWDIHRRQEILTCHEFLNTNAPKAALFSENGEIKIAILLFDQTDIESSSNKIINLSSWYAKESHRGIDAIRFAKKLTLKLCDYTITNYTPSDAVKNILIALGYKYMNVGETTLGLVKIFPFIQLRHIRKNFKFSKSAAKPVNLPFERNLDISQATYQLVTVRKFGLKLGILNIFLQKDERFISFFWLVKHCFLHGVLRVNVYAETESIANESPWLIKSLKNDVYIHPQKSELSIDQYLEY